MEKLDLGVLLFDDNGNEKLIIERKSLNDLVIRLKMDDM